MIDRIAHQYSTVVSDLGVSLPCPPWGYLDADDRSATAPRGRRITADRDWKNDPVLRHASKRKDRG